MSERPTETAPAEEKAATLDEIRQRIDAIDAEMHALLIERSSIIDSLIAVKKAKQTGVAFRPGREADMMHRIADRHHGTLPLLTVEHLWREIISTFTYLQAAYDVHVASDGAPGDMRDVARFYFGFTVPLIQHETPADAIETVHGSRSDLAIVPLGETKAPWWQALDMDQSPRIISRLPFLQAEGRSAGMPAVLVSNPLDDPVAPDMLCYAAKAPVTALGGEPAAELMAWCGDAAEADILFAVSADVAPEGLGLHCKLRQVRAVGGFYRTRAVGGGRE